MEKNVKKVTNGTVLKILEKYKTLWSLGHLMGLAHWDLETYMPKEGIDGRSEAVGNASTLSQRIFLEKEFVDLILKAQNEKLNDTERAIVRILKRSLKYYQKLPPKFIEEFSKLTSKAHAVWAEAKEKSDFSHFQPYLERIVEMSRKKAEYLGYKEHPYDALLDEFEEGMTTRQVEEFFERLKPGIIILLDHIKNSRSFVKGSAMEGEKYDVENMKRLNMKILETVHGNSNNLRLDVSSHPFTISMGPGDARITTRYSGKDFKGSFSSTVHEFGHALYELQFDRSLGFTPLSPSSLVIHESQSRFWENILGRSKEFESLFHGEILKLGKGMKRYSSEDLYRYFNLVCPSLIRTEADEVSYHLHIMIRFEIEKGLIEGSIKVKDLPKIWGDKYEEYLGIRPKNDREGVLQDVHWSGGGIGYFPTYSMGTALSVIWKNALEKEKGDFKKLVKRKDFKTIKDWLRKNIHQYGAIYDFNALAQRVSGQKFSSDPLLKYLNEKYRKIYP